MGFLQYIFYLGVINIVFLFIWKWLFAFPIALLFTLLKIDQAMLIAKAFRLIVKAFGTYLLASLTALLTLTAIEDAGVIKTVLYPLIGGVILFMSYASYAYEASKQAQMDFNYEMMDNLKYDGSFMIGAVSLFLITLFFPAIANNSLIEWLFEAIGWVYELPVIGWIVKIVGVLIVINIIFHGFLASGFLIGSLVEKVKKSY